MALLPICPVSWYRPAGNNEVLRREPMKRALLLVLPIVGLLAADPVQPPVGGNVNTEKVTFRMQFTVTATPGLDQTTLTILVPKTVPQRQKVVSLTYSK